MIGWCGGGAVGFSVVFNRFLSVRSRSGKERTPSTPVSGKGSRKSRIQAASEGDSSENEGTTSSTTASPSLLPDTRSSTHHHPPSDQLEKSDRISKEKQKFFRLSAMFADKKRAQEKRKLAEATAKQADDRKPPLNNKIVNASDVNKNRIETVADATKSRNELSDNRKVVNKCESKCRTKKSNNVLDKNVPKVSKVSKVPKVPNSSSSSSDESQENQAGSDSSDSSDCSSSRSDESTSSDSDSDSSQRSDASRGYAVSKLKPSSSLFISTDNKSSMTTFGSISGISDGVDNKIWGFAAAAAAAAAEAKNNSFGAKNTFGNFNSFKDVESFAKLAEDGKTAIAEKVKPGFGQLKGLFDGLSHLFTAKESRSRTGTTPNYNPSRRKRANEKSDKPECKPEKEPPNDEEKRVKLEEDVREPKAITNVNPKPETAVGIASVVTKQSNITIPPKIPKRITPTTIYPEVERKNSPRPPEEPWTQMTPSNLVKTAVNSKRHELERRNFLKGDIPFGGLGYMGFSHSSLLEDVRMKKRNLIAEATQTNHPLSVPQPSNNQQGKMGHRTLPINPSSRLPSPLPLLRHTDLYICHAALRLKPSQRSSLFDPYFRGRLQRTFQRISRLITCVA